MPFGELSTREESEDDCSSQSTWASDSDEGDSDVAVREPGWDEPDVEFDLQMLKAWSGFK